jgi:hypothetical protein
VYSSRALLTVFDCFRSSFRLRPSVAEAAARTRKSFPDVLYRRILASCLAGSSLCILCNRPTRLAKLLSDWSFNMRAFLAPLSLIAVALGAIPTMDFTMSVSPPPEPGAPFRISWAPPISGGNVKILLNNYDSDNSSTILSNVTILSESLDSKSG